MALHNDPIDPKMDYDLKREHRKKRILSIAGQLLFGIFVFLSIGGLLAGLYATSGCASTKPRQTTQQPNETNTASIQKQESFCASNKEDIKRYRAYLQKDDWPSYSENEEKSRRRNLRNLINQYNQNCD